MINLFIHNPELKRNAWLELKPNRLITMPVLLVLMYIITISLSSGSTTYDPIRVVSLIAFHILITIWGSKQTADAVATEINEKTWDRQRMTGLDPWKMVIGKLFGPTLFQWYGALIVMFFYFVSCIGSSSPAKDVYIGIITISTGLFVNAFALLISLLNITGNSFSSFSNTKINTTLFFVISLVVAYQLNMVLLIPGFTLSSFIKWYGLEWGKILSFLSVAIFIGWAIMGIYRNLRTELQYKNKSTVWNWFLLFIIIFSFGFSINTNNNDLNLPVNIELTTSWSIFLKMNVVAYVLISVLSFLILFERKSLFEYNAFVIDLKAFNFKKLSYSAPLWFITSVTAIVILLILSITSFLLPLNGNGNNGRQFFSIIDKILDNKPSVLFFVYAGTILLLVRDILLTRYLIYCSSFKNKTLTIIIYFVIVYIALPTLFKVNGLNLFFPIPNNDSIIVPLISLILQASGAAYFYKVNFDKLKQ